MDFTRFYIFALCWAAHVVIGQYMMDWDVDVFDRKPRKEKTITIGHLSGDAEVPRTGPAISLALERWAEEGNMLDYNIT